MRIKHINIIIRASSHALRRWKQLEMRGDPELITGNRLFDSLKRGAIPDKEGAIHIYVGEETWGVVVPELQGGWNIITFYVPGVVFDDEYEPGPELCQLSK